METSWLAGLLGGGLIGIASSLLLLAVGRVFGVSGVLAGAMNQSGDERVWRIILLLGLVAGGLVLSLLYPQAFPAQGGEPRIFAIALAGWIVGFGTQLGSGCTSGHGICGISRLSSRSIVATCVFVGAGMLTVFVRRMLGGGL